MYHAYFRADGTLLSVSSRQTTYPDDVLAFDVPDSTNADSIYLDLESQEVRSKQAFAVEVAYNQLSGLPVGTLVTVNDTEITVEDGSIEFEADVPELVLVFLNHPHFFAAHIEVATGPGETMKIDIKKGYAGQRANEYPTWEEQMDYLFHHGYDAWKAMIQAIKDRYPKPSEPP